MKTTKPIGEEPVEPVLSGSRRNSPSAQEETVIPVMHEELDVQTRRVETDSGVRITKKVQEREEIVDRPLTRDEVSVERVAINRPVDAPVSVRYEGDTMIVPILEEVLVVEKRLMLKEEIRITRRKTEIRSPQRVTLRRESAAVERIENAPSPAFDRVPGEGDSMRVGDISTDSLLERKRREQEEFRLKLETPPPAE